MNVKDPLGKCISIIYRYSIIHANNKLKPYNITGSQLTFFMTIVNMAGITQEELSNHLKINKSTTAKAIQSLEKNGYVIKKVSKKDRRAYNLYPTQKALELYKKIRDLAFQWDDVLCKGFSKEEKESIYKLIEKMAQNASEDIK